MPGNGLSCAWIKEYYNTLILFVPLSVHNWLVCHKLTLYPFLPITIDTHMTIQFIIVAPVLTNNYPYAKIGQFELLTVSRLLLALIKMNFSTYYVILNYFPKTNAWNFEIYYLKKYCFIESVKHSMHPFLYQFVNISLLSITHPITETKKQLLVVISKAVFLIQATSEKLSGKISFKIITYKT